MSDTQNRSVVGVHYRVGRKIGEGSFGVIFEGPCSQLGCRVTDSVGAWCRYQSAELADSGHQIRRSVVSL